MIIKGCQVIKLYTLIFFIFITFLIFVNTVCFISNKSVSYLLNPYYLGDRAVATYTLIKTIVFETGVTLKKTQPQDIDNAINNAINMYNISSDTLYAIINTDNEFRISRNGGMGIFNLTHEQYITTPYSHDYQYDKNTAMRMFGTEDVFNSPFSAITQVYAFAYLVRQLMDTGFTENEAVAQIILAGSTPHELELKATNLYEKYLSVAHNDI